ncbi:MAG: ATP-binding cassette domain-containing protein, partial [Bacteroidetes bacterium]|nr:ATP-binding cassette domain-containing protein [Bacteroidota bacterium]
MLEVKGLTKVFSERKNNPVVAVNDIAFTCHPGTIVGLVGPNGAGKTTAMRVIATILSPTSGTAFVDGFDIRSDAQMVRSRIGFLTGETGIYDRLTACEILSYFGKLHGMGETAINSRIEELAEVFGIGNFLNMRVQKMSSGMR